MQEQRHSQHARIPHKVDAQGQDGPELLPVQMAQLLDNHASQNWKRILLHTREFRHYLTSPATLLRMWCKSNQIDLINKERFNFDPFFIIIIIFLI